LKIYIYLFIFFVAYTVQAQPIYQNEVVVPPEEQFSISEKPPWTTIPPIRAKSSASNWEVALYWLPNRLIDFFEIFKIDLGIGPSLGVTARATSYLQGGFRSMYPTSLRIGLLGEETPYLLESANEFGLSPFYHDNTQRDICNGEFGIGIDAFILGAYAGFCPEELVDFIGGIFTADIMDDDM
jgi:hypothetical protein